MQAIVRTFLKGLLAFLPVFITVYAVYYFGTWLNGLATLALGFVLPDMAGVPGLGIVLGVGVIFLLGLLVSSSLTRWIYRLIESPLRHLPIIKELYIALKQLTDFLSPKDEKDTGQVVSIRYPEHTAVMIGLLMRDETEDIGFCANAGGLVGVYLPMSYQIGGFTVFVPREWVTKLDMPVETALRETLTGWMKAKSDN